MAQSLARLHVHLVFSTKHRQPFLEDGVRSSVHAYIAAVLKSCGCHPVLLNSVNNHIHILFELGRTAALSAAVQETKSNSSRWIKSQGTEFGLFAWQAGYAAFAVDMSNLEHVRRYIERQREHHTTETFQDEYRRFLIENQVEFD